MKDWGESVSELMIKKKKITRNCTLLLGCFYLLYMFYSNFSPVVLLLVLSCVVCNCCWLAVCIVVVLCVCFYLMCICCNMRALLFFFYARLLARSQYSEGPATGYLNTGFSWFSCA